MKRQSRPLNHLRVYRAVHRLTQTDVAKRMKFPTKFRYWQIENEAVKPTEDEVKKLAKIFGCTESDLGLVVAKS